MSQKVNPTTCAVTGKPLRRNGARYVRIAGTDITYAVNSYVKFPPEVRVEVEERLLAEAGIVLPSKDAAKEPTTTEVVEAIESVLTFSPTAETPKRGRTKQDDSAEPRNSSE